MIEYCKKYEYRYAIYRAYESKCFFCKEPISFNDLNIDHIIPQKLKEDNDKLSDVLSEYEILKSYPDFTIDSLLNLVPCHGKCNHRKKDLLLPKETVLYYLLLTHKKISIILNEIDRLRIDKKKGEVLAELDIALEQNKISVDEILEIINSWKFRMIVDSPLVVCFGLNINETLNIRGMTTSDTAHYINICDNFESELFEFLRLKTNFSFHTSESSARNGETLSVRLVFPELKIDDVNDLPLKQINLHMPWWEILEINNYFIIYNSEYKYY